VPWWSNAEWQQMKSDEGCPMCVDGSLVTNEHSDLIAELPFSFARLHRNQAQAGYCVVILKGHATELHELDHTRLAGFWYDVAAVGRAVTEIFQPVKIDSLVMGHRCPHLHCHVYPQYASDDPLKVVDISAGSSRLRSEQRQDRISQLRKSIQGQ